MYSVDVDGATIDLIQKGRHKLVTDSNKEEYVAKLVEMKLIKVNAEAMMHLRRGFKAICPKEALSLFSHADLCLLLSGLPNLDLDDWKCHTVYSGPDNRSGGKFSAESEVAR